MIIFLAPPTIGLNPITLDDRVPRPAGQAVASIWLVGQVTCCHGGTDLSFHHYCIAAFAASGLALSPPSPFFIAPGLYFVWGASEVAPQRYRESELVTCRVGARQCHKDGLGRM